MTPPNTLWGTPQTEELRTPQLRRLRASAWLTCILLGPFVGFAMADFYGYGLGYVDTKLKESNIRPGCSQIVPTLMTEQQFFASTLNCHLKTVMDKAVCGCMCLVSFGSMFCFSGIRGM